MPHVGDISTKWRGAFGRASAFPVCIFSLCLAAEAGPAALREARYDSALIAALDAVYRLEYDRADAAVARIPDTAAARPYFGGLVGMNRFADLGDTAALRRAESQWERLSPRAPEKRFAGDTPELRLYRGLAGLQLSYLATLRGGRVRAATLAWSARGQLLSAPEPAESKAALALFDYYRSMFLERLSFLPFVNPHPEKPLHDLKAAAEGSRYLRDVLRASAFWIHFDRGECDSALGVVDGFLVRYPQNRTARQMRGDALFRCGRLAEAHVMYDTLLREYARLRDSLPASLPVGYYCAAGNLARIAAGLGRRDESRARLAEWRHADALGLTPWLPASLKRELARLVP